MAFHMCMSEWIGMRLDNDLITASFFIVAFRSFDSIEYDEDGVKEAQHGFGTRHLRVSRDGISYVHERMDRHEA